LSTLSVIPITVPALDIFNVPFTSITLGTAEIPDLRSHERGARTGSARPRCARLGAGGPDAPAARCDGAV